MNKILIFVCTVSVVAGCGSRNVRNVDDDTIPGDGAAQDAKSTDGPKKTTVSDCVYPDGTCTNHADCPGGACKGALPGQCKGRCIPDKRDPDKKDPCPPASESVRVELTLQDGDLVIKTTNIGCEPIYQIQDCCGWAEMPYGLQVSNEDAWEFSMCNPLPEQCLCDAEPVCGERIDPGQTLEARRSADGCSCPGGKVRVERSYYGDASCETRLSFHSNELSLGCAK